MLALILLQAGVAEAKWPPGYTPVERTWFSYGARYTSPQRAALSLTVMRAVESDMGIVRGWFIQAEPGLAGGKASVGHGYLSPNERWFLPPVFGVGVKASILRTWGSPDDLPSSATFLGPEADLSLFCVKVTGGYLWRVAGQPSSNTFTWGVGWGSDAWANTAEPMELPLMALLALLLILTPPPAPGPLATRQIPVCSIRLEAPRGAIVVGKVCLVSSAETHCDGEDIATVPEFAAFGQEAPRGAKGVLIGPTEYQLREERYESETRYVLVPSTHPAKTIPYLSLPKALETEVESRKCPDEPIALPLGDDVVVFATGKTDIAVGGSLRSLDRSGAAWLVVTFTRVR